MPGLYAPTRLASVRFSYIRRLLTSRSKDVIGGEVGLPIARPLFLSTTCSPSRKNLSFSMYLSACRTSANDVIACVLRAFCLLCNSLPWPLSCLCSAHAVKPCASNLSMVSLIYCKQRFLSTIVKNAVASVFASCILSKTAPHPHTPGCTQLVRRCRIFFSNVCGTLL